MTNKRNCKLWSVLLALSLILSSSLMLGVSAQDSTAESTQPIEPGTEVNDPAGDGGAAPDNESAAPEGSDPEGSNPEGGNNDQLPPPTPEGDDQTGGATDTPTEPEVDANGLRYMLNAEGTEYIVTGYEGTATEVVIPAMYNDLPVTEIGDSAFERCVDLTNIEIPSSVVSIGNWAFFYCISLENITFGENSQLTNIGYGAFSWCNSWRNIEIPDSVISIGEGAFSNCWSLLSIEIPSGVTYIGVGAFERTNLTNITVEQGNTAYHTVGNCLIETESKVLLAGCHDSTIPTNGSVTSIGEGAFSKRDFLTSVVIPDGVTSIGARAFNECSELASVELPDGLMSIGESAFDGCSTLDSITIPDSVTSIGAQAFRGCSALTSITFLSPTTEIWELSDTIPETSVIHGYAGSTAEAYAEKYERDFVFLPVQGTEGLVYTLNATGTQYSVTGYEGTAVHVIIPESYAGLPVTRVTKTAFANNTQGGGGAVDLPPDILVPRGVAAPMTVATTSATATSNAVLLQSMTLLSPAVILEDSKNTIPSGVAIYGYLGSTAEKYATKYNRTFAALDGLAFVLTNEGASYMLESYLGNQAKVTLPATYLGLPVTAIGEGAFAWSEVSEVVLPNSILSIGDNAFYRSALKSITVPASVTFIGTCAFNNDSMESMVVEDGNAVYYSAQNCIIETATSTLIAGCKTSVIPANGNVTVIGGGAFARIPLTSIAIPDAITTIMGNAFAECADLESVTFGSDSQLISIGACAFWENCSLTEFVLPASLVEIGYGAFYCCCGLEQITLGAAVESVGEQAFADCDGLTKITIRSNEVDIFDAEDTISATAVIYGYADSTAQAYAEKYGREFVEITPYVPGDIDGVEGVSMEDAIYLLFYTIFPSQYPVEQPCDYNHDSVVTMDDAIYLLFYTIFPAQYPLT